MEIGNTFFPVFFHIKLSSKLQFVVAAAIGVAIVVVNVAVAGSAVVICLLLLLCFICLPNLQNQRFPNCSTFTKMSI